MNNGAVTILLADDHTIVRQGLVKLLEAEANFRVVGEARDGREAVRQVERLQPDVVLMDLSMPLLNGIEATRQIKKLNRRTRVIILSMHSQHRFVSELLGLGASGFLVKESTGADIVKAIEAAMKGDTYLSPCLSPSVLDDYVSLRGKRSSREERYGQLSNREREVFQRMAEGKSAKEISEMLYVSVSTVKTHRAHIMEKLQIDNLSQLVQFAIELGVVEIVR